MSCCGKGCKPKSRSLFWWVAVAMFSALLIDIIWTPALTYLGL
jgi:hypothetical protein